MLCLRQRTSLTSRIYIRVRCAGRVAGTPTAHAERMGGCALCFLALSRDNRICLLALSRDNRICLLALPSAIASAIVLARLPGARAYSYLLFKEDERIEGGAEDVCEVAGMVGDGEGGYGADEGE